jgi:glycosyltransferase 2 family protein
MVERWSPVDALRMVVAASALVLLLLVDRLIGDSVLDFVSDVLAGFSTIDPEVVTGVAVATRVLTLGFLGAGLVSAVLRGRWGFLITVVAGGAVGALLMLLLDGLFDAQEAPLVSSQDLLGSLGDRGFPTAAGLAAVTGVVAAGVPWFQRRWRRLGWALVLVLAGVRGLTAPLSFETAAALACGALAGALADAALGTPSRRPPREAVVAGLERSGVQLADLEPASVDARGSTPYFGTTTDGTRLFVKALGADERNADVLFRLVRSLTPRNLGDEKPFSSLRRAVEHEALVALAAAHAGVRTPPLAGFASAEPGAFVLAYEGIQGRSLDGVDAEDITDDVLAGIWEQMGVLRAHGIAHRDLRLANVFLADDGAVWFIDFGFSELAASELLLATDLAELVTSLSLKVGDQRAVAQAEAAVGAEALAAAKPRFAPGFLSGATRTALKERAGHLEAVRARIGA